MKTNWTAAIASVLLACSASWSSTQERTDSSARKPIDPTAQGSPSSESGAQDPIESEAERLFARGSFEKARELFDSIDLSKRSDSAARRIRFRRADSLWRSKVATKQSDRSELDRARDELEKLVRDVKRDDEKDLVFASVQESLGDFWIADESRADWGQAWTHYQEALAYWARSSDLDVARARYLAIVWRVADFEHIERYGGWYNAMLSDDVIENALAIATSDDDRARAHYLAAANLSRRGADWRSHQQVEREYRAAIDLGRGQNWYDDALFGLAQWCEQRGALSRDEQGRWREEPDFVAALKLYQRITEEFKKGESRWWDNARQRAQDILATQLSVGAGNAFLPNSEVVLSLSTRNVAHLDFRLYAVDLVADLGYIGTEANGGDYASRIDLRSKTALRSWTKEVEDRGDHRWHAEQLELGAKLDVGAYVVVANGGGRETRDLVLVSDAALVLKSSGTRTLAWFVDAQTGAPIVGADVKLSEHRYENNRWSWSESSAKTGADGIASFERKSIEYQRELVCAAELGHRSALAFGNASPLGLAAGWRIQAITDRPAYRPEDKVQWKIVARRFDGSNYSTPSKEHVKMRIVDPQGAKLDEQDVELSEFGSAFGELALNAKMPLGEYRVDFEEPARSITLGSAAFFRLEEYKLPEFEVKVETPEENGKKKLYRLGDVVEAEIAAEYYSGGAVADAQVEFVVYQRAYHPSWQRPREFAWYFGGDSERFGYGETEIQRATLKTDAKGRAKLRIPTPLEAQSDFEYRIEARVTDLARREIVGEGRVRVTRQGHFVFPSARHNVLRPHDKAEIDFAVRDANDQPVSIAAKIELYRERWRPMYRLPSGEELSDEELRVHRLAPGAGAIGAVEIGGRTWREKISERPIESDAKGAALFTFEPAETGAYIVVWKSLDLDGAPIEAECTLWVASDETIDLGWRRGELELIVDRDTLREGDDAILMISSAQSGAWVLFSVESEELHSFQVLHLEGNAKLVHVKLDRRHVPSTFVSVETVRANQVWRAIEELVVPPASQFLSVELAPKSGDVLPGAKGAFAVSTRDANGEPVSAELSIGVFDEAVLAIQASYASDPRAFFYGEKRAHRIDDNASIFWRRYARFVRGKDGKLTDELVARLGRFDLDEEGDDSRLAYDDRVDGGRTKRERALGLMDSLSRGESSRRAGKAGEFLAKAPSARAQSKETVAFESELASNGAPVTVRSDFRATAFWKPNVVTGADGKASVELTWPQSLSRWKTTAIALDRTSRFGFAQALARTNLPLTVRLESPRFLVVGDRATVSMLIQNHSDRALDVRASFSVEGLASDVGDRELAPLHLDAGADGRIVCAVEARVAGAAKLHAVVKAGEFGDATETKFTVWEHGIDQLVAASGKLDANAGDLKFELPSARRAGSTTCVVRIAPSIAVTMLDALPYLVDYPYGCTEQTMSRFLPAAITAKTLKDLGLDRELALSRVFGGIEREWLDKTHPKPSALLALEEVERKSLERIGDFQHADGGWGWWKEGESDRFMSAYVVWGLALAKDAGVDFSSEMLARGTAFLDSHVVEAEDEPDLAAWILHALGESARIASRGPSAFEKKALDRLWSQKEKLNAYTRALFAIASLRFGARDRAETLVENLANGVTLDRTPDASAVRQGAQSKNPLALSTAHWGSDGIARRWSDASVESTATVLRALIAIAPKHELVQPAMNWLVANRRGAQWSSTRDTAISVLALGDYLRSSGELSSDVEFALDVNGTRVASKKLDKTERVAAPLAFAIDPKLLRDGANDVHVERVRGGPLYLAVETRFFGQADPIQPEGDQLFVRRRYWRITAKPSLLAGFQVEKHVLAPGEIVASGDRIQTELTLEAKNDLEYLVLEDLKPAGLEAVALKSGEPIFVREIRRDALERRLARTRARPGDRDDGDFTDRQRWMHQELRDREVALFVDKLAQGVWTVTYEMRAEAPGVFKALPLVGRAMYVPEIRANGLETNFAVH